MEKMVDKVKETFSELIHKGNLVVSSDKWEKTIFKGEVDVDDVLRLMFNTVYHFDTRRKELYNRSFLFIGRENKKQNERNEFEDSLEVFNNIVAGFFHALTFMPSIGDQRMQWDYKMKFMLQTYKMVTDKVDGFNNDKSNHTALVISIFALLAALLGLMLQTELMPDDKNTIKSEIPSRAETAVRAENPYKSLMCREKS